MTLDEYLRNLDDSHPMTTAREHIAELCRHAAGAHRILELGSHQGVSTAAMALAAPSAEIVCVDLCDTVSNSERAAYWASLGLPAGRIEQRACDAGEWIRQCNGAGVMFDLVFHDAVHGDRVTGEYLLCAKIGRVVAIHDFEQLSSTNQSQVAACFRRVSQSADTKGRVLFIGDNQ